MNGPNIFPIAFGGAPAPDPKHRGKHSDKRAKKTAQKVEGGGHCLEGAIRERGILALWGLGAIKICRIMGFGGNLIESRP